MRAYYGTFGSVVEYPRIEIEGSLSWHFGEHISADLRMVVVPSAVVAFDAGPRVGKHHDENFQRKRDTERYYVPRSRVSSSSHFASSTYFGPSGI